jgi:hypothetical protein
MLRYRIVKSYPTKAAVGQVQMHFFTKAALIDTGLTIAGGGSPGLPQNGSCFSSAETLKRHWYRRSQNCWT